MMADLGRQGSSESNNSSSSSSDGGPVSGHVKETLKVPGNDELQLLAKLEEANRYCNNNNNFHIYSQVLCSRGIEGISTFLLLKPGWGAWWLSCCVSVGSEMLGV